MTALTLILTSVAALDVTTGVREEKDHKQFTMTEADPMANHLDITAAGRSDCTSRIALGRTALASGAGCNTETNETCATKYEEKFRGDHRVGETWTASLSLVGEVHLCEMRPASVNGVNQCMAGQIVTVCPEEEVVETSDGGAAGSATGAGDTVSAAATTSSTASGTPNSCSQQLAITAFASGTATVITSGMCEDQGLCTPTLAHCEAAAAEISHGGNGRGNPSFGDEDRNAGNTCALCTWWAASDVRSTANGGRRRHHTLLEYTYNAAAGYNDCGATTNNGDDAGCVCVPC